MNVRLTHIDGSLPNLALMRLSSFHKAQGDAVFFTRSVVRDVLEPHYGAVYGSTLFTTSAARIDQFRWSFPGAIVGGTGSGNTLTIADVIGQEWDGLDYGLYPDRDESFGFSMRGCRFQCPFCVVPKREGKARATASIWDIWRGDPHPRKIHLFDNDFFGSAEWEKRIDEIREGNFRVCFGQGINLRILTEEQAAALATIEYRDTRFKRRRLYTAWDNLKDERVFFRGVDRLEKAGIPPTHLRVYMLVGFDKAETWAAIMGRFQRMVARGIEPYPMVFDASRKDLKAFQRWVVTGLYRAVPWEEYRGKESLFCQ